MSKLFFVKSFVNRVFLHNFMVYISKINILKLTFKNKFLVVLLVWIGIRSLIFWKRNLSFKKSYIFSKVIFKPVFIVSRILKLIWQSKFLVRKLFLEEIILWHNLYGTINNIYTAALETSFSKVSYVKMADFCIL